MHKELLILIVLVLLTTLVLKFLPIFFTGLLTQIFLSVGNSTQARFIYFSYPSEMTLGSTASFSVELQNIGSMNITSAIGIQVKDSSLNTLYSSYDVSYTLAPSDIRNFSTTYTPTSAGTYYVFANASYNSTDENKTVEENRSFTVTAPPTIPTPPAYPGVYIPPIVRIYNLTLEYPKEINLTLNESYLIPLYATNYGNVDLHNFSFLISVEKIEWEIIPNSLSALPPGTTAIFLISVKVPSDVEIGNYTLDFRVITSEIAKTGRIKIVVSPVIPLEFCPDARRAIRNYADLIDRVGIEIEKAASQGRNVTRALMYYREARKEFDLAKDYFNSGDCEAAKKHLELVKKFLILTIIELAKSIIPSSPFLFYALVIILTAIAIATIVIAAKRKKLKMIVKPVISVLSEERGRKKKSLGYLEKLYRKKKVDRSDYELRKRNLEKDIERNEIGIIMRFGTERQMAMLENMKKAYKEEIISKEMYNKSIGKLADNIIKQEMKAHGKKKF